MAMALALTVVVLYLLQLCNMYCCQPPDTRVKKGPHFHPFIPWMAPEIMQHLTTSYVSVLLPLHKNTPNTLVSLQTNDVYSFGVLAWELWGEEEPWAGLSPKEVWRVVIREGQRLSIQGNHSSLSPLLEKCLGTPSQRVSITEVHTHLYTNCICPRCIPRCEPPLYQENKGAPHSSCFHFETALKTRLCLSAPKKFLVHHTNPKLALSHVTTGVEVVECHQ